MAAASVETLHGPGVHSMALYCDDYGDTLAAYRQAGAEVAFSGLRMGASVCWLDTRSTRGLMVKLAERNPAADRVYAQLIETARNWDKTNPVRALG